MDLVWFDLLSRRSRTANSDGRVPGRVGSHNFLRLFPTQQHAINDIFATGLEVQSKQREERHVRGKKGEKNKLENS